MTSAEREEAKNFLLDGDVVGGNGGGFLRAKGLACGFLVS